MFQPVVECRSHNTLTGDDVWVGKLACGCEFRRMKQKRGSRKTLPAPVRMKCYKHPEAKK